MMERPQRLDNNAPKGFYISPKESYSLAQDTEGLFRHFFPLAGQGLRLSHLSGHVKNCKINIVLF
jgi:hypothetical protein